MAIDVQMLVRLGGRLYAPGDGEALVTEDWVTNKAITYAYYASAQGLSGQTECMCQPPPHLPRANQKVSGGHQELPEFPPALVAFMESVDKECMMRPRRIGEPVKCSDIVDENLSKKRTGGVGIRDGSLRYRNWARAVQQQVGGDPWPERSVAGLGPQQVEATGALRRSCTFRTKSAKGAMDRNQSAPFTVFSVRKTARVVRLQEMANNIGIPLVMEQIETQILTQHKDARGDRSARGGLGIMKDIAKKAVLRKKEYGTLHERLINNPFYAYTAARGDLTPSALEFIEKVAPLHHPSCERTKEMIKGIVAVPKYAARLTLVPPQEDVKHGERNPIHRTPE